MKNDLSGVHIFNMTLPQQVERVRRDFLQLKELKEHSYEIAKAAIAHGASGVMHLDKKWMTPQIAELVFNASDRQKQKALESLKKRKKELGV